MNLFIDVLDKCKTNVHNESMYVSMHVKENKNVIANIMSDQMPFDLKGQKGTF